MKIIFHPLRITQQTLPGRFLYLLSPMFKEYADILYMYYATTISKDTFVNKTKSYNLASLIYMIEEWKVST